MANIVEERGQPKLLSIRLREAILGDQGIDRSAHDVKNTKRVRNRE